MSEIEHILRRELDDAFRNRGHLYRLMLDELDQVIGPDAAEAMMTRVVAKRGVEVAGALFAGLAPDPVAIGRRFLSVSPDCGRLYPHERQESADNITIAVSRCPLKDAWRDSGLPDAQVARLCRIAGAFDRALFEAAGVAFENSTWSAERGGGCCVISLSRLD